MKRLIFLIIGLIIISLPAVTHAKEVLEQTKISAAPSPLNVVLTWPSENSQWLLKLKSGCSALEAGQNVKLGVTEALNGKNDYLDLGLSRTCGISKAFLFNQELTVLSTNRNQAAVRDQSGKEYSLFHDGRCGDLLNWVNKSIYADQAGSSLAKGDTLFVPGEPLKCSIKTIKKAEKEAKPLIKKSTADTIRPSDVVQVRAIPRNGKAFIYWKNATDNISVNHYLVSVSRYKIDRKHMTVDSAERQRESRETHLSFEGLENDTDYYFYVMAVDSAGNTSSFWSEPAHARVLSSISPDVIKQTGQMQINLHLVEETETSFLFAWQAPPTTTRFMVTLTSDSKPEFSIKNSMAAELRIEKKAERKGKKLIIKVNAFNTRGFIGEEKIEFSF